MSLAKDVEYTEELPEVIVVPPVDLWSDEPPLESDLHRLQMQLLIDCLVWLWHRLIPLTNKPKPVCASARCCPATIKTFNYSVLTHEVAKFTFLQAKNCKLEYSPLETGVL
jgi:hypothetical protein